MEEQLISQKEEFTEIINNYKGFVEKMLADKKEMKQKIEEQEKELEEISEIKISKDSDLEMAYSHIEELERENHKLHTNISLFVFSPLK